MAQYYYFNASGEKVGPVAGNEIKTLAAQGIITPETPLETDTGHKGRAGQIKGLNFHAPEPPPVESDPFAELEPSSPSLVSSSQTAWEVMKQNGMIFLRWVLPILKKGSEKTMDAAKKGSKKAMEAAKKGSEMAVDATKKASTHVNAQLDKIPIERKEQTMHLVSKLLCVSFRHTSPKVVSVDDNGESNTGAMWMHLTWTWCPLATLIIWACIVNKNSKANIQCA